MNKLLIFITLFSFLSCVGDDEKVPISASSMEWFFDGNTGDSFSMINTDNIQESYVLTSSYGYNLEGGESVYGLDVDLTYIDEYIQAFQTTYAMNYSMSVNANYAPFGDRFYFSLGDVSFAIDLGFEELTEVSYKNHYHKSLGIGENHYYQTESGALQSTIEYLDDFEVGDHNYTDVLHFTLNDFQEQYDSYTIRHIYFAKHYGLVFYSLNNGIAYQRI